VLFRSPDLFSVTPAKAARPFVPPATATPGQGAKRLRHVLPKDLAGALRHLENAELDALVATVTHEAERRGRLPRSKAKQPPTRETRAENGAGLLTSGKLNAVRAAFKAGVKPSTIARQFGISQSDVRKVLGPRGRGRT
jgi:hypothetical protein